MIFKIYVYVTISNFHLSTILFLFKSREQYRSKNESEILDKDELQNN